MKLVYRHSVTGQRITKRFVKWNDLLNEAWRVYFRSLDWAGQLDCICEAGCDSFDEVWLAALSTLNS